MIPPSSNFIQVSGTSSKFVLATVSFCSPVVLLPILMASSHFLPGCRIIALDQEIKENEVFYLEPHRDNGKVILYPMRIGFVDTEMASQVTTRARSAIPRMIIPKISPPTLSKYTSSYLS